MDDLAAYIADNYGQCDLGGLCYRKGCLNPKNEWLGRGCQHWHPVKARNWEELKLELCSIYTGQN